MINTIQTQNPTVLGGNISGSSGYAPVDPTMTPNLNENKETIKKFSKTPQRKSNRKYLIAGIILLLLTIGGGISLYLIKVNQDLRQQASEGGYTNPTNPPNDPDPTTPPTTAPTTPPTTEPTIPLTGDPEPTTEPTTEPTAVPTNVAASPTTASNSNNGGSSSSSSSSSSSNVTVNLNNKTTGTVSQPSLPQQLPKTGPEDWLKYLQVGLGALGAGALLLLFL